MFVGILVATKTILKQMTEIFGSQTFQEKQIVWNTMVLLSAAMCLRLVGFMMMQWFGKSIKVYFSEPLIYTLSTLTFWFLTVMIPSVYLFKIHYRNFMSLEGHEYLQTEQNEAGNFEFNRTNYSMFDDSNDEEDDDDLKVSVNKRLTIASAEQGYFVTGSLEEFSNDLEMDDLFNSTKEENTNT